MELVASQGFKLGEGNTRSMGRLPGGIIDGYRETIHRDIIQPTLRKGLGESGTPIAWTHASATPTSSDSWATPNEGPLTSTCRSSLFQEPPASGWAPLVAADRESFPFLLALWRLSSLPLSLSEGRGVHFALIHPRANAIEIIA